MTLDLKTLLKLPADYPGFDFAYEKWAMEIYLKVLEDYLPQAQDQYRSSARRELMEQFGDHWTEEMKHEASEIDEAADREIPRFFRISAIMPIWGMFESFMLDFAKYVAKKERISLPLREVKGSTMEQIEKYFKGVLRIYLPWTEKEQAQLQDLQELRNRIAHRNGRIDGLTEDQRQKAQQLASKIKGVEIRNGRLLVSAEYVNNAATLVFNAVEKLEQLVTERYHLV